MDVRLFDEAFGALPEVLRKSEPVCSIILGSGWNRAVADLNPVAEVLYSDIPNFGGATVIGHSGKLLLAEVPESGAHVLAFCGRRHYYEGVCWESVVMPVVLSMRLGIKDILATNAAGSANPDFKPGDVVVIEDHLNLFCSNTLTGGHNPEFGPRFPDQSRVYSVELCGLIERAAERVSVALHRGVYAFSGGPAYETPAEIRAYRSLGADVVGMSTVPEAIVANACGIRFAALSFVSNMASGMGDERLSGEDVIACAEAHSGKMAALILEFLRSLPFCRIVRK